MHSTNTHIHTRSLCVDVACLDSLFYSYLFFYLGVLWTPESRLSHCMISCRAHSRRRTAVAHNKHTHTSSLCTEHITIGSLPQKNQMKFPSFLPSRESDYACLWQKNQATQPKPYSGVDLNEGTTESNQATVPGLASTGPHSAQELYLNAWTEGEGTTNYVRASVCLSQFRPRSIGRNAPQQ